MKRSILIVDHGSVRLAANDLLNDVADVLRGRCPDPVYVAHMELARPTIDEAFDQAVAEGAEFVFVFPYFLAPGRHSREDIPRLCAQAAGRHPGIRWHCSGPIGLDPLLADLILHRLDRCEEQCWQCDDCADQTVCRPSRPKH